MTGYTVPISDYLEHWSHEAIALSVRAECIRRQLFWISTITFFVTFFISYNDVFTRLPQSSGHFDHRPYVSYSGVEKDH